jgi:sensor histidine kinase YesM
VDTGRGKKAVVIGKRKALIMNRLNVQYSIEGHQTMKQRVRAYFYGILNVIPICVLIALALHAIGLSSNLQVELIFCLSYGISMFTLSFWLSQLFNWERDKLIKLVFLLIAGFACGSIIGWYLAIFILQYFFSYSINLSIYLYFQNIGGVLAVGGPVSYYFYSKGRLKYTKEIAEKERLNRLASEKEALEAKLRLLQAQIEPHFLFNTLSNILSLIDTEPSKGKSMLMDLIHFLRTSLSRTLPEMTTLGQEMDALKSYLNIQKIRLGDRLVYTIKVDEALGRNPFPPMLLQPLVENSIKHGLEPKVEGGEIVITAAKKNGKMRISVSDTGLGFSSFNKTGVGVANVKERIRVLYGMEGRFILEENNPTGVRAIIEVPRDELQSNHS